jgi:KamA family protein
MTLRHPRIYTQRDLERIEALKRLPDEQRLAMRVVASVLPFRVNDYVIDELIDWNNIPEDPIFQLTFPQRGMLAPAPFERMTRLHRSGADAATISALATEIRADLNPHPGDQMNLNVPHGQGGDKLSGLQHKYRESVLVFPPKGQTCHAYCTYCFRWPQFVGDKALRISSSKGATVCDYLVRHPEVKDVLLTGGDPMVMKASLLAAYLEPLLAPSLDHVRVIRIGTKALSFWPHRFVTDPDADELLALLEKIVEAGKHPVLMAHFSHWREMDTAIARAAIRRLRGVGVEIRSQAPVLAHINDDPSIWARLWNEQVALGIIPYYMFVARDTGAHCYFEVPLGRTWEIYRDALQRVSGLARTVRGPSMSAGPGKIDIQGVADVKGERVFVLRFIQGRNPDWVQRPFFAGYDEKATWLDQLKPAFGEKEFFFEAEYRGMGNYD